MLHMSRRKIWGTLSGFLKSPIKEIYEIAEKEGKRSGPVRMRSREQPDPELCEQEEEDRRARANSMMLACVKRAIDAYGGGVLNVVLWDLNRRVGLSSEDVASNPEEFVNSIREVFGNASCIVEERITQQICEDFHFNTTKVSGLADAVRCVVSASARV